MSVGKPGVMLTTSEAETGPETDQTDQIDRPACRDIRAPYLITAPGYADWNHFGSGIPRLCPEKTAKMT